MDCGQSLRDIFIVKLRKKEKEKNCKSSPAGFEPATSGLEVQRAIHCATGTYAKEANK